MSTKARTVSTPAVVLVLTSTLMIGGCGTSRRVEHANLPAESFINLVEATVSVRVAMPSGRSRVGSGFVATRDGWIVTSNHVLESATAPPVLSYATKRTSSVDAIYTWAGRDLAIIVPRNPPMVTPLRLASSRNLEAGAVVFACGVPFGLGHTLTRGIVDGRSEFHSDRYVVSNGLVAASLSYPGDSGGPVVNSQGQVVGVHLGSVGRQRRAVVPSSLVRRTLVEARVLAEIRRRRALRQSASLGPMGRNHPDFHHLMP